MNIISRIKGLSLIELMVALTVSSFLMLGLTQVFSNYKRNHQVQQETLSLQNNTRYLNIRLTDLIAKAGQIRDPSQDVEFIFPEVAANATCGKFFRGAAVTNLANNNNLGFCIRYQPLVKTEQDCQGNTVKVESGSALDADRVFDNTNDGEMVVEAIVMTAPNAQSLASGSLSCTNLNSSVATNTPTVISTGVAGLKIEFGVGAFDSAANEQNITKFIAPASIAGVNDRVLAIRYQALMASQRNLWSGQVNDAEVFKQWISDLSNAQQTALKAQDAAQRPIYMLASMTQLVRGIAK